jgi:hypothetical protein
MWHLITGIQQCSNTGVIAEREIYIKYRNAEDYFLQALLANILSTQEKQLFLYFRKFSSRLNPEI